MRIKLLIKLVKIMVEKIQTLSVIAIILGASGLGLGAYSAINFQVIEGIEGPQGPQGQKGIDGLNGVDGQDAPGGITVGILDPDSGEIISGNVTIKAIIFGSENYTLSVLRNGTEIGTSLPMEWNTVTVADGWWNLTIVSTDIATNNSSSDQNLVYVKNIEITYIILNPILVIPEGTMVFFNLPAEGIVHLSDSFTNTRYCLYRFVIPNNYDTEENITFHIVWGAALPMTVDYRLTFSYATDGNPPVTFSDAISSWTGPGQGRRNYESFTRKNTNLPGKVLTLKFYMEDQNNLDPVTCYGVWLEVPVT
jgi:hypothetical protein